MPTVPVPDYNPVKQEALPGVRFDTQANPEAFNAGQSAKGVGEAIQGLGTAVVEHQRQERERADQVANIAADTAASKLQTDIQMQVIQMKGQDAFGASDFAEKAWKEGIDEIRSGLQGENQQLNFERNASGRYGDLNKSVQMHTMEQSQAFDDQTTQSGIEQARTSAVVNAGDNAQVETALGTTKKLVDLWAQRKGIPQDSEIYKNKVTQEISATHNDVIQAKIMAGLDEDAKKYFEEHKAEMSAGDVLHAAGAIENSEVITQSKDIWDDIQSQKGFKYNDGSINGEAVRKYVMDNSDLSDQRKIKVLSQVKAMAKEYNIDRYHQIAQNERSFTNQVVSARQNGLSVTEAMKNVGRYSIDPYDAAVKTAFVEKTYAPPADSDVKAHEALREGITAGTVDLGAIDQAAAKGDINAKDWASLRQLAIKTKADGTDPQSKYTDKLINDLATQSFGNDKDKRAQFNYVLNQKAGDKSPDEKLAIAKDLLKEQPDPKAWFWGTIQNYKPQYESLTGKATATGAIYEDLGYKQSQAISAGISGGSSYQRNPDPAGDIHTFAGALGLEYKDLKVGTPANNAVQSLILKGKKVTPAAVQAVLKKYPDGKWQ